MASRITLRELAGSYAIARLEAADRIPAWADGDGFVSINRTDDELSIACREERVPSGIKQDGGWTCYKLQGPFAFGETGIVLSVIQPLSENGIGIFVVSTFDGDHLLIKTTDRPKVRELLQAAGHTLV
ncbi:MULTISPECIES: ACT domain-containing protein [unclassified Neorhizobium]|uniref:ACT domain-containing protein n=1 Tax=unclassified Neorhizobium TaxID=2629175 RepID=UPI001FF65924|nr:MULTISPECIES: ACT domain-containing protein [unclassified Neorhizobium]MCJ9674683.1 ACT domain-containing protein [Neorhizobium sp. SHOUNA12B]MCJ9749022.1 ACT domain-containing protein [Neorhizobium sp. SHOUNA12A]